MQKELKRWGIIGVFIIFGLAAAWHYLYDLLPCDVIGAVAPVNESPWEQVKLFFVPAIIFYVIQYFVVGKRYPNFIFAHSVALLVMPVFMLLFYYAYSMLLPGGHSLVLDPLNALLTIALGSFVGYRLTMSARYLSTTAHHIATMVIIIGMLTMYVVFTFDPPIRPLFYDRSHMQYGI